MRGVGQGNEEMGPSAFSHVGEQFMRVFAILIITYLLVDYHANPYEIGIGALYGSLIGSFIGCVILTVMTKGKLATIRNWKLSVRSFFYHNLNLFKQSIFICLNALVLLLFQLVDVFTIVRLLQSVGVVEEQAFLAKGIYDRGQPLLQLGTILTTTVALALVPLLSKSIALNKIRDAQMYRDVSMRMAVLIGGGATLAYTINGANKPNAVYGWIWNVRLASLGFFNFPLYRLFSWSCYPSRIWKDSYSVLCH